MKYNLEKVFHDLNMNQGLVKLFFPTTILPDRSREEAGKISLKLKQPTMQRHSKPTRFALWKLALRKKKNTNTPILNSNFKKKTLTGFCSNFYKRGNLGNWMVFCILVWVL